MRRRLVSLALTSSGIALLLFLVPLAVAVFNLYRSDAEAALERDALKAAVTVDPNYSTGDTTELPVSAAGIQLGLYSTEGIRLLGSGPTVADAITRTAADGSSARGQVGGDLIAAVPLSAGEQVTGTIRASSPIAAVWMRAAIVWAALLAAAIAAVGIGLLAARALVRRVTRPIQELTDAARALGAGDFQARVLASGIPEIDQAGSALSDTSIRLRRLIDRERYLAANASHQLRTPLAGMRLLLEQAADGPPDDLRRAAYAAIDRADALDKTIDDFITLSREHDSDRELNVVGIVDRVEHRWRERLATFGRPLRLDVAKVRIPPIGSPEAVEQILDVLLDNATIHGKGAITLRVRSTVDAVAFDVEDEGHNVPTEISIFDRGVSTAGSSGVGLSLARELATDMDGVLLLAQRQPSTRFTLLLPEAQRELRPQ